MITILVLEDEKEIYRLLTDSLRQEGYSFINEPESGGLIKIIKRNAEIKPSSLSERILDFKDILLKEKDGLIYKSALSEIEKQLIESILEQTEGNQLKAAKILGINRNTVRAKIKKLGINSQIYKH